MELALWPSLRSTLAFGQSDFGQKHLALCSMKTCFFAWGTMHTRWTSEGGSGAVRGGGRGSGSGWISKVVGAKVCGAGVVGERRKEVKRGGGAILRPKRTLFAIDEIKFSPSFFSKKKKFYLPLC